MYCMYNVDVRSKFDENRRKKGGRGGKGTAG